MSFKLAEKAKRISTINKPLIFFFKESFLFILALKRMPALNHLRTTYPF